MNKIQNMKKRDDVFVDDKQKIHNNKKKLIEINIKDFKFIQNQEILLNNKNKSIIKANKKNFNIKNNVHFSFLLKLFLLLITISYSENNLRALNEKNEIILIVKEVSINQRLISEYIRLPDEIIINGEKKEQISTNYELNDPENIIILRWNSSLDTCKNMFYNLDSAISVDFSNFDSSKITDMTAMFYGCKSLKSVNFNNIDTPLLKTMDEMFYECFSLISVNFSCFNTSLVTSMKYTFNGCTSLITLDLSNFKTNKLESMEGMFKNAESLISLDLSNFNISLTKSFIYTFYGCKSLIFLNLNSFEENGYVEVNNMFSYDAIDLIYCINVNKNIRISSVLWDIQNNPNVQNQFQYQDGPQAQNNDCNNICFSKTAKIIIEKKQCIDYCENDDTYIYEYNNICYNYSMNSIHNDNTIESNGIVEENIMTNFEIITNNQFNENFEKSENKEENTEIIENIEGDDSTENTGKFENEETQMIENAEKVEGIEKTDDNEKTKSTEIYGDTQKEISEEVENKEKDENEEKSQIEDYNKYENNEILENFSVVDFFKGSIDIEIANEDSTIKDEIIKTIKDNLLKGNLDDLLLNVTNGEKQDLIMSDKNTIYQITTSENQKKNEYSNVSTINLGDCEDRLKNIYGINKNLSLLIFKIDYFQAGLNIPVIEYEVYHPINKSQLDLKYCEDISIILDIPVSINESVAFKYDPSDEYYNDECSSYTTENGTDITLDDRRNEYIDNNLSLCEVNCTYKGYNEDTKKALCECESKIKIISISDIMNNENILANNFSTDNITSNTVSLKCAETLFTKEGLLTNIGNYLLSFTFIFFIISAIIFYKCGYHIIEITIKEIISLKEKNEKKRCENIDLFKFNKKLNQKKKKKKKRKKNLKVSNPVKKAYKKIGKITKTENNSKQQNLISATNLELRKTNIFINIGKNENKIDSSFIESNNINMEKPKLIMKYKDFELNSLDFEKALKYDKRIFCQNYYSLLKYNNILLFSFYLIDDYNIKIIKISLFFLSFDIYFFINSLFFNNSTIHKIYEDGGSYNFSYFITKIIISFFISYYCIAIIKYFTLSQRNLLKLKNEEDLRKIDDKAGKTRRCLNIKYILFYTVSFIFLIFFWYYLSTFCAVYKNTQFYVIINTFISFGISLLYPFIFNILPCIIRIASLKNEHKCLYKISQFIHLL